MNIQDYAKYYIGCRCLNTWFQANHEMYNNEWVLDGYREHSPKPYLLGNTETETWTDSIKPILRKLDSITDEEIKELIGFDKIKNVYPDISLERQAHGVSVYYKVDIGDITYPQTYDIDFANPAPHETIFLLSKGFDLFGLIKLDEAIDASTLTK